MFETDVFGEYGADYIAPQMRGMLGPLTPQLRGSLRQRLKTTTLKS